MPGTIISQNKVVACVPYVRGYGYCQGCLFTWTQTLTRHKPSPQQKPLIDRDPRTETPLKKDPPGQIPFCTATPLANMDRDQPGQITH